MGLLPGFVMVAAGAFCFGGAVIGRRWIGIVASAVMLLAMLDLAVSRIVAPVLWAGALVASAVLLGIGLRGRGVAVPDPAPVQDAAVPGPALGTAMIRHPRLLAARESESIRRRAWLPRAVMVAAALAYPATAWLVLGHSGQAEGTAGGTRDAGATLGTVAPAAAPAHHSAATLTGALPLAAVILLIAALLGLGVLAIRDRRTLSASEAGGMAAMLLAMLAGHG
ncbi:hypothetical protein FM113_17205 [Leucobacter sp. 7(1)]|uniref:hypothetical protein n=1 Tax=Leucobacter sp. 7(1) TaxID=1255613 RepID=UPI00097E9B95|nr:hypothetical protein [Leucobacter sp. 7(1)]SJN13234.1 hypothetical protein FM113_17205 [Leucobacter sp. 7(1)]